MNEETNVLSGVCSMILDVSPDFCFYTVICKVRQWTDFRIVSLACHLSLLKSAGFLSRIPFGLTCQMSEIGKCHRIGPWTPLAEKVVCNR